MTHPEPDRADVLAVFPVPTDLAKVLRVAQALVDTHRDHGLLIGSRVLDAGGSELVIYANRT